MALFDVTQAALERAIAGASLRHALIADNIANANTPGYKRRDLDFGSLLARALDAGTPAASIERLPLVPRVDAATSVRADGNNVDLDVEIAALHENSVVYQTLLAVAKARLRMLATAAGGVR